VWQGITVAAAAGPARARAPGRSTPPPHQLPRGSQQEAAGGGSDRAPARARAFGARARAEHPKTTPGGASE